MATKIFVNLPVKDLEKSVEFFTKLGYTFNPQFTDENATCMVIDDDSGIYAMLLVEPFFKTFIPNHEIADATKTKEVLTALSCDSREAQDLGFMYGRAYQDLDNHIWELFYMDITKAPSNPGK